MKRFLFDAISENFSDPMQWINGPDALNLPDASLTDLMIELEEFLDGVDPGGDAGDNAVGEHAQEPTGEGPSLGMANHDVAVQSVIAKFEALTDSGIGRSGSDGGGSSIFQYSSPELDAPETGWLSMGGPVSVSQSASQMTGSDMSFVGLGNTAEIGKPDGAGGGKPGGGGGGGGGGDPVLTDSYTSGDLLVDDLDEYNIQIDFYGDNWTDQLKAYFVDAADYLSTIIYGDIEEVELNGEWIDDIVINASLTDIDGQGGVLGQAGPTYIRGGTILDSELYLPLAATMEFDIADAQIYADQGQFYNIVLHEMMHSIGFGSIWELKGLVETTVDGNGTRRPTDDTVDSRFTGDNATAAFQADYPELYDGLGPYIETDGGTGTADVHWDETTFGDLLMTGYLTDSSSDTLSDMSIASLEDLGYQTTWGDAGLIA